MKLLARVALLTLTLAVLTVPLGWVTGPIPASAQDRVVKIAGVGAMTGVIRGFGINSKAVFDMTVDELNQAGGIKLADGTRAKIVTTFMDERCNAEEGISVVRKLASEDWLVIIGPTCSNVAEPLFGILQRKVGDAGDSGLQVPIFTDTAIKPGLAKISEWAFRNVPHEPTMYNHLFKWLKQKHPDLKTVYGGVETDFAHSNSNSQTMDAAAKAAGFEVLGWEKWLLNDTEFSTQVGKWRRAKPDIIAISSHPFTTCGTLREMQRQGVKPKLLVGLTSTATLETMAGCGPEAEGLIIPTGFAPVTPEAQRVAKIVATRYKGNVDLHSAAVFENFQVLKKVIETSGVEAKPTTLQQDRRRVREGLAKVKEFDGLLGKVTRLEDRESVKPYVFAIAKNSDWTVLFDPR
ncbi:MAG: ABC transporter substrate-binding protein [Candidatus Rokubacteria bacterium]|nr:ABC transporter substrate-binding protein [Candidatus Rokubacteria bacterium]